MIRLATVGDLGTLETCAREFYASSRFLKKFDQTLFQAVWTHFLETGAGVIFLLETPEGEVAGALGGVVFPDLYSGELVATEFFWFVREGKRGSGLLLYRAFEEWAREKGCAEVRMVHLLDSMPEKLNRVYRHLEFTPTEVHYAKELT